MPEPKKRFIAGAVCPKCSAMDRIVMYRIDEVDFRECVECGFSDQIRFQQAPREMPTRVNVTEKELKNNTDVVKILETPKQQN